MPKSRQSNGCTASSGSLTQAPVHRSIHRPFSGGIVRSPAHWAILVAATLSALGRPAPASDSGMWPDLDIRISPLVVLANHGYFRFRFNELYNLDLGSGGASGFLVGVGASDKGSNVTGADLRLSYQPVLTVGEYLSVHARVDLLDNIVLGETPATFGAFAPAAFARTLAPPSDGRNAFRDSVRVKAAWADIRLFERIHVLAGRMPEHFGLGILRNDGRGSDSDFGDFTDAVFVKVKLATAWFRIGMEFPGEGATTESPYRLDSIFDAESDDDIMRWTFVFDSKPVEKEEREARARRLLVERKPVVDWGMYHSITKQKVSSERVGGPLPAYCATGPLSPVGLPYDCYTLTPRGAFIWTPALWGRLEWHPRSDLRLRVEAEADLVYGFLDHAQAFVDTSKNDTSKRFIQEGVALEAFAGVGPNEFGLLFGYASGGNTQGRFGFLDAHTLAIPDDARWAADPVVSRYDVRHFWFNPDYRVDSILFREVIGTVTNAIYVKPTYRIEAWRHGSMALAVGAGFLVAMSAVPEGTPGKARMLGLEPSLSLDFKLGRFLSMKADAEVLFPLSGMRERTGGDPESAGALRTSLVVGF